MILWDLGLLHQVEGGFPFVLLVQVTSPSSHSCLPNFAFTFNSILHLKLQEIFVTRLLSYLVLSVQQPVEFAASSKSELLKH